jgi:tetratricopeptide (TPR) repeat protein
MLAIRRTALGEHDPEVAQSLNNLAELYRAMSDYAAAEPLYQQALEAMRATQHEKHPHLATIMNNLGLVHFGRGAYPAAKSFLEQALAIWRAQGEAHPGLAFCLNNLAQVYQEMGDYGTAEQLLQESIELRRVLHGENSPAFATAIDNLARLFLATGDYAKARPLFERAIRTGHAPSLAGLAELYWKQGHYHEAETLLRLTLQIQREELGVNNAEVAKTLDNLAGLAEIMGNYAEAERLYRQAGPILRQILGKNHPDVATHLNQLAQLYATTGNYAAAEEHYQQALEIWHAVGHIVGRAGTTNNLALLYYKMGNLQAARPLFEQALQLRRQVLGENHPDVAQTLNNLATLYYWTGNYASSEPLLQQALDIYRTTLGEENAVFALSLHNLATVFAARGRAAEALKRMGQVEAIHDRLIGKIFGLGSERQRMTYLESMQDSFYTFLSLLLQHLPDDFAAMQAGFDLVLRRKAITAEALAAQRDAVLGGRYPGLAATLEELNMLRTQIAQKMLAAPATEEPTTQQAVLAEWNARRQALEAELAQQIPEINLARLLRLADRQAVARALPTGAVLVEFVHFPLFNFTAVPAHGESPILPAH